MAYDNTNRGVLFKNTDKKSEKHPDYSGSINVDGAEFFLDAWIKEAESGRKYMSLSIKKKTGKPAAKSAKAPPRRADPDDDIPW